MHDFYLYGILGLPTWTLVDGTWAILSQLADVLPEGYNISAYLILSLTFGNIVPLFLGLTIKENSPSLQFAIYSILYIGLITGIILAVVWDQSVSIANTKVSLPLFIMFFIIGACASSSNVTHYTFVSRSEAHNTTSLATGMGLGSMTSGILALFQGLLLKNYSFNVTVYYIILAILYIPALIAFQRLNSHNKYQNITPTATLEENETDEVEVGYDATPTYSQPRSLSDSLLLFRHEKDSTVGDDEFSDISFLQKNIGILSLQLLNSSLGYGFIPALISYACGKFNNKYLVLQLATGITAVIDPLCKFSTYYGRIESFQGLLYASIGLLCLSIGLILCATLPENLTLYTGIGGILPVTLYVSFMGLFGYTNTCVFRYFKLTSRPQVVHHSYRWSGICSQTGALIGSLLAFCMIVLGVL